MTDLSRLTMRFGAAVVVAWSLSACSPNTATRGSMPEAELVALITPGVHGPDDVRSILGAPSAAGTFDQNTWYYIGRRTEQYAFLDSKTVEQQVLIVRFGANGRVAQISRLDKDDARDIALVERETPSAGRELGVFRQLFGNIGRFNAGGGSSP